MRAGQHEHQLFQRKDDEEDTVANACACTQQNRSRCCLTTRMPGLLRTVRAEGALEDITQRLLDVLTPAAKPVAPKTGQAASRSRRRKRPEGARRAAVVRRKAKRRENAGRRRAQRKKKRARAVARSRARRAQGAPRRGASQSAANNLSPTTLARQPRSRLMSRLPAASFSSSRRVATTSELISRPLAALAGDVGQAFHQRELRGIGPFAPRQRRRWIGDAGVAHQRQQFLAAFANHRFLHFGQRRERLERARQAQRDFAQPEVVEYPATRPVAFVGAAFAPRGERLHQLLARGIQRRQTLDLPPCVFGRDAQRVGIGERRELFLEPGQAAFGGERL